MLSIACVETYLGKQESSYLSQETMLDASKTKNKVMGKKEHCFPPSPPSPFWGYWDQSWPNNWWVDYGYISSTIVFLIKRHHQFPIIWLQCCSLLQGTAIYHWKFFFKWCRYLNLVTFRLKLHKRYLNLGILVLKIWSMCLNLGSYAKKNWTN